MAPPGLKCYSRERSVTGSRVSVKRLLRHRLLHAVLALCLLGQLGVPVLGFAQPCAMPAADDHAMAMEAHRGAMPVAGAMDVMDSLQAMACCEGDGPCLMAHCMAPNGACSAEFVPAPPAAVAVFPSSISLFPRTLPQRHFRPPIAA